ncbi:MAG TPA: hypothetical protein VK507_07755, partial [Iamia sp.]|nr:hypothetical protein [Iamia sp.]
MNDRADEAADRRRVLELALTRRPELTLADLHQALDGVGLDVDTTTLVQDLDELGFDIEGDGADGDVTTTPTPPATDPPVAAGVIGEPDAFEPDAFEPGGFAGSGDGTDWWKGRTGVIALSVAVLVVALLAAVLLGGGDDDDTAGGGDGGSNETAVTAQGSAAPAGPVETAPVGPGEDQELVAGVDGASAFDEAQAQGLGVAPDGSPWEIRSGSWSVADGVARLDAVEGEDGVGLATFDPGLESYRLQVRLATLANGNGLAFGAAGPDDYFTVVAAPGFSTFFLVHVTEAGREVVGNSKLTATEGGRAVIGVHVTAGQVDVLVNGAVVLTQAVELPGTAMGLGSIPGGYGGRFDEVSYR